MGGDPQLVWEDLNQEDKRELKREMSMLESMQKYSYNFFVEYDVVPRLARWDYVYEALGSATKQMADSKLMHPGGFRYLGGFRHAARLVVFLANQYPDETWRMVVLKCETEKERFLCTPWPFPKLSTCIAIEDHSVLPSKVSQEWRNNWCVMSMTNLQCKQLRADFVAMKDCRVCKKTFCEGCFTAVHKCAKTNNWHHGACDCRPPARDGTLVPVRNVKSTFEALVDADVQQVLKELHWFSHALQMARDEVTGFTGAMNIFFVVDMVALHLGHSDPLLCCCVAGIRSAVLLYKLLWTGTIDIAQFWEQMATTWFQAASALTGAAFGCWIGGCLGSVLGPLGTFFGVAIGATIGSLLGKKAIEEIIAWLKGAPADQKDRAEMFMVCKAMMEFKLNGKPSELTVREVRKRFRMLALEKHPDKTGLSGKTDRTEEEDAEYSKALTAMQNLQHHCDVLEAFIKEKHTKEESWLKTLDDDVMDKVKKRFGAIDEDAAQKKANLAKDIALGR